MSTTSAPDALRQELLEPRLVYPSLFIIAMLMAFCEGIDIGSMGVTLSRLSENLGLTHAQAGLCASASLLGLMISATAGGWLADRYTVRPVTIGSILLLSLFSFATTISWDFYSLLIIRFCLGLGMGSLYPILLTAARSAAGARFRATAISMVVACGPLGALAAAVISLLPDWRSVFYCGGIGPLLALPAFFTMRLPSLQTASSISRSRLILSGLFGKEYALGTITLWATMFSTSLCVQLFINWLPSLLVLQGFTEQHSRMMGTAYFIGAITGNLTAGTFIGRIGTRAATVLGYGGAACCTIALALAQSGEATVVAVLAMALFLTGAQLVGTAMTPGFYPPSARVTGTGAMISVSRCGAVCGPILAGLLLQARFSVSAVLLVLTPIMIFALFLCLAFQAVRSSRLARAGETDDRREV